MKAFYKENGSLDILAIINFLLGIIRNAIAAIGSI